MSEEESTPPQPDTDPVTPEAPPEPESFGLFNEDPREPITEPGVPQTPVEEPPENPEWKQRLERDRIARRKEVALKKRERELSDKIKRMEQYEKAQKHLKENPGEFFRMQGIDPMETYSKWTEQVASEVMSEEGGVESRVDDAQRQIKELKEELAKRDETSSKRQKKAQRDGLIDSFHRKIENYAVQNKGYSLVKEKLSAGDVADGISAYYRQTGKQLSLKEAFDKLEEGLKKEEESFFGDPKQQEKFRKYTGQEATPRRRATGSRATLTDTWSQQPTRDSARDMSYDEIREHWKGKLFT